MMQLNDENRNVYISDVVSGYWKMSRVGGDAFAEVIRFLPDGRIKGHEHPNERSWDIQNGCFRFIRDDGLVTTTFDQIERSKSTLVLRGQFIGDASISFMLEKMSSRPLFKESTNKKLSALIDQFGWSVGDHSYGTPTIFEPQSASLKIGRFCSIAEGVMISLGNHDFDNVSSYPFVTLQRFWAGIQGQTDHVTNGDVEIGNDVWIGAGVFINSGVKIGNGAVLGAHTIVTKDVPPYAVCVGNPGRVVRYRFSPDQVAALEQIAWWNWSDDSVEDALTYIVCHDIDRFITRYGASRKI